MTRVIKNPKGRFPASAKFSASAEFFACADFIRMAFPSQCGLLQNTKTERSIKFLIMACKTSLLLLNKINVLLLAFIAKKNV